MATREMSVNGEMLKNIAAGRQDLIVQVMSARIKTTPIRIGDILVLGEKVRQMVKAVRHYTSFRVMLDREDHQRIYPGLNEHQAMLRLQRQFAFKAEKRGVIVYEIVPLLRLVSNAKK